MASTDQANSSPNQSTEKNPKQILTPKNTQNNSLDDNNNLASNNQSTNPTNNYYNFQRKNAKDNHSFSNIQELSTPEINQQNYKSNNPYRSNIHNNYSTDNPYVFNYSRPYIATTNNYSKELNDGKLYGIQVEEKKDESIKSTDDARFYSSEGNPKNVSSDNSDSEEKKRYVRPKTRYYPSKKRVVDPNSDF